MLNTFSGPSASTGDWNWSGINVYLDEVKSTFAGRKVELLKEDDQFNPQVGLEKMRKFVENDKVDLIVGLQGSNIALAVLNYVKQSKAFLLISGAGTDAITWERVPYMFRSSIASWQLCHPFAEWIYDNLAKEMVVMSEDYAGGHDVAARVMAPFIAKGGKITKEIYVPITVTDYSPYLTVVRSLNPPVVYDFSTGGAHAIRFVQQWAQSGIKAKLAGFAGFVDATTVEQQGRAALGVLSSTIYTDALDNPVNQKFVAAYREKTKEYPNLFLRLWLCVDAGHRRSLAGDGRRRLRQGQVRRGDGEGAVRRTSRAVPLRSGDAQPDPERLYLRGAGKGRAPGHRDDRHQEGCKGPADQEWMRRVDARTCAGSDRQS